MNDRVLSERRRSLEDEFFARRDREKLEAIRRQLAEEAEMAALARTVGIRDAELVRHLIDLGISSETVAALTLVPLIEVAWADGEMDDRERESVLVAAAQRGMLRGSPSHALLSSWLAERPKPSLRKAWAQFLHAVCTNLTAEGRRSLREDVMGHARGVAEAAGGILGLGNRISAPERKVLSELAAEFPP